MATERLSWDTVAHRWFEEELQRIERMGAPREHIAAIRQTGCSPQWLLPDLVQLLAEASDRPVAELEPAVRERVIEQQFVDGSGAPAMGCRQDEAVQLYVTVCMRVLERLRQHSHTARQWAHLPATPQMFG